MPSRRLIREKALLSLFSSSSLQKEDPLTETHWNLILEPENKEICKVSVKTLSHQLQALPKWEARLSQHAPACATLLKTYEEPTLAKGLLLLVKKTAQLTQAAGALNKTTSAETLQQFLGDLSTLKSSTSTFLREHEATSYTSPEKAPLTETLRKLEALYARISPVRDPLKHPEEASISSLYKLALDRSILKEKSSLLVQGAREHLPSLDETLSALLENFSTEQLGRVEMNLLRLAAYEILILEQPKPVIINEALELAKKYASEDAAPLLNGVLDKL